MLVPAATAEPTGLTVGFTEPCLTTAHHGPLTVAGGALAVTDAEIDGPLCSDGALAVTVCGSRLTGPVTLSRTSGPLLLGSGGTATPCAAHTVRGPVEPNADR
ncbi:hypothetical protein AB0B01_18825 [Streptomyces sp. NPDC044571]|uniref:hypothetical protein n=1 Tax=Streptomyces sp. NPDC044571 TaxID=3155371 RepID=UPI003407348D